MSTQKKALVCGAGGFIGGHLVKRLKDEGYFVRSVDIKQHKHQKTFADEYIQGDLREQSFCREITGDIKFDELYQLAADMGGGDITLKHDPRVLPVGRFLRKTKINELPQLINILIGDMSVVGPRPQTPKNFEYFPPRGQRDNPFHASWFNRNWLNCISG
jgi:nucleoside-diphosphate-sugar epimerase